MPSCGCINLNLCQFLLMILLLFFKVLQWTVTLSNSPRWCNTKVQAASYTWAMSPGARTAWLGLWASARHFLLYRLDCCGESASCGWKLYISLIWILAQVNLIISSVSTESLYIVSQPVTEKWSSIVIYMVSQFCLLQKIKLKHFPF